MIYTRFGTPVEIVKGSIETGTVDIIKNGDLVFAHVCDLKADGGIKEVEEAIIKANKEKEQCFKKGE